MKNYLEIGNEINSIINKKDMTNNNSNALDFNPNIISLYDIYSTIYKKAEEFQNLEKNYNNEMNSIIKDNYSDLSSIVIYGMDFDKCELSIGFKENYYSCEDIKFSKKNNNLYIVNKIENSLFSDKIFKLLNSTLSSAYDNFIRFKDIKKQHSYEIKCFNSFLLVNIYKYGVDIFDNDNFNNTFKLQHFSYSKNYVLNTTNNYIFRIINDNEEKLFKNTFVKIDDCPKWMRKHLYEIRKNQIIEKTNSIKVDDNKKEENKSFKMKILSLLKK